MQTSRSPYDGNERTVGFIPKSGFVGETIDAINHIFEGERFSIFQSYGNICINYFGFDEKMMLLMLRLGVELEKRGIANG